MKPTLRAVHPVLMSGDVGRSLAFFARLGFRETFRDGDPPRYAAVVRDGVELHLQWHEGAERIDPRLDRPTYRFVVDDLEGLFAEFEAVGVAADEGPFARPRPTPWGTTEFHLRDPDRNGLQFYRPG